jgi:RNA polymerase sigma-70 factor (ECF subfamily)
MTSLEFHSQLVGLDSCLLKFAYSMNLKRADAKDLVQETYLRALNNQHRYVDDQKFKSWAMTIMRNTFIDNYRKNRRNNTYPVQSNDIISLSGAEPVTTDTPDSSYSVKEITKSIEELNDTFRIPLTMYISGYKYWEIAENLDINIGTVKNRIFKSRKQLINRLKD